MNSELLLRVRTVEEKEKLSGEINKLLESMYREKGEGLNSTLKSGVRYWVSELIKEEGGQNLENMENYLKTVLSNLEKLKVMNMTLAFQPTETSIEKFINAIRRSGTEDIILDFSYDPSLLAGAIISFEGEYRDFSLKRLYEEEYKAKEEEIMKIAYSK